MRSTLGQGVIRSKEASEANDREAVGLEQFLSTTGYENETL